MFDRTPIDGFQWIDDAANAAAAELREAAVLLPVVGHSDWVWQMCCVSNGRFLAGYDWDSLVFVPEGVVVGLRRGAFTQGSPQPPDAPVEGAARARLGRGGEASARMRSRRPSVTPSTPSRWVRCYNARCQIDNQVRRARATPDGSFIEQLAIESSRN